MNNPWYNVWLISGLYHMVLLLIYDMVHGGEGERNTTLHYININIKLHHITLHTYIITLITYIYIYIYVCVYIHCTYIILDIDTYHNSINEYHIISY